MDDSPLSDRFNEAWDRWEQAVWDGPPAPTWWQRLTRPNLAGRMTEHRRWAQARVLAGEHFHSTSPTGFKGFYNCPPECWSTRMRRTNMHPAGE